MKSISLLGHAFLWGAFSFVSLVLMSPSARAQSWLPTTAGIYDWNTSANWSPGPFPNSTTATVTFINPTNIVQTVNLNQAITINQLSLGGSASYTFAAGTAGSLIFSGATPGLTVSVGSAAQFISAPVSMTAALTIVQNSTVGALTFSGTFNNGGITLTVTGAGDANFTNTISGGGGLTKTGSGTLTLTGTNNYSGLTTVSSGILQIGDGGTTGTIAGNITNNASIIYNRSDSFTYAGVIGGTGSVTKLGAGTLTFTGANTYSGGTTISAGTLQVGNGGSTGSMNPNGIAIGAFGTLAFNRSDSTSFAGVLSGTGNLQQLGSGTLIVSGANTFSGTTTISAGTLQLGSGSTNGTVSGPIINNSILAVNRSNGFTLSSAISGSGALTKLGVGTLTLSGINSFSGATTISVGAILFNAATALGNGSAGSMTIASGAYASANYALDQAFLSRINSSSAGAVALNVASANALDFNTPGLTGVSLGATANVTYSGAITPAGNTYRFGGGSTNTLTVSSNLTGANSLVTNNVSSSTTVILSGTNNYTGTTTIGLGILQYASAGAMNLGTATVTVASGSTAAAGYAIDQAFLNRINPASTGVVALNNLSSNNNLDFSTPGLTNVSFSATGSTAYGNASTILIPASNTYRFGGGATGALTINAPLTGAANSVVISGNGTPIGTIIFGTTNTYGGSTTINGGTLQFNSALAIGGTGASVLVSAGAASSTNYAMDQAFLNRINSASAGVVAIAIASSNNLDFNTPGLSSISFGSKNTLTYSGTITPHATTFRLGGGGGSLTVSSNLTSAANNVVVRSGGNLILAGINTFGAGLSSEPAQPNTVIIVTNANGLSTGNIAFATRTVAGSITSPVLGFDLGSGTSTSFINNIALDTSSVTKNFGLQALTTQTIMLNGIISGGNATAFVQFTNSTTNTHTGTFVLGNALNGFLGTIEVSQGTLSVANDGALGGAANGVRLSINSGTLGGFHFAVGFNTARPFTMSQQSRIIQSDAANPATISGVVSGSATLYKAGLGTLTLSNVANTFAGPLQIDTGILQLTGGNSSVTTSTVTSGAMLNIGIGGTTGTLGGTLLVNSGATASFNRSDAASFNGIISGGGSVTQQGSGTLTLSANNTFAGSYLIPVGTLSLTGTNSSVTATTVSSGSILKIGSGPTGTLSNNITNDGMVTFNRSNAYTYGGTISGAGSISQQGAGIQTLSGSHTYSGPTTVAAGTLLINGATAANSTVGVSAGATLGGTGTIAGVTIVNAGGRLAPGDANVGTLSIANAVTINGGSSSTWFIDINGLLPANADRLAVSGTGNNLNLLLSSANKLILNIQTLNASLFVGSTTYTYIIATADAGANIQLNGGTFAFDPNHYTVVSSIPITTYSLDLVGNQLQLNLQAVPEPVVLPLLVFAFFTASLFAIKRRTARLPLMASIAVSELS
ncbi:hypothetical protein BH11PLA2_BH11PLA2_24510 [soil metagenome]